MMAHRRGTLREGFVLVCVRARDRRSRVVRAFKASRVRVQRVSRLALRMQVTLSRGVSLEEESDTEQIVGAPMAMDMPESGGTDADASGGGGDSGLNMPACDALASVEAAGDAQTRPDDDEAPAHGFQQ